VNREPGGLQPRRSVSFLLAEVGFYLYNNINQMALGYPPFMHLVARDVVLTAVCDIGYLNMLGGLYFISYLIRHRRTLGVEPLVTTEHAHLKA
jgi:hypothetical protein